MRLRQNQVNRRNVIMKHKRAHRGQIFVLNFARTPPTAIRAKAKLTSKVWNYLRDVPTAG
jgi:hypothetical protein